MRFEDVFADVMASRAVSSALRAPPLPARLPWVPLPPPPCPPPLPGGGSALGFSRGAGVPPSPSSASPPFSPRPGKTSGTRRWRFALTCGIPTFSRPLRSCRLRFPPPPAPPGLRETVQASHCSVSLRPRFAKPPPFGRGEGYFPGGRGYPPPPLLASPGFARLRFPPPPAPPGHREAFQGFALVGSLRPRFAKPPPYRSGR